MARVLSIIAAFVLSASLISGCQINDQESQPVIHNDISLLQSLAAQNSTISELYYEEMPVISHYSGGVKIVSTYRVWLKNDLIKSEHTANYYKNDELIDEEYAGELFDYSELKHTRYYLGNYPDHIHTGLERERKPLVSPRDQSVLWYLDKASQESHNTEAGEHEGEKCLVVEILKNNYGSTLVWISSDSGLPVKIQTSYNNNISQREYVRYKVGKGSVNDQELLIPAGAITH